MGNSGKRISLAYVGVGATVPSRLFVVLPYFLGCFGLHSRAVQILSIRHVRTQHEMGLFTTRAMSYSL